MALILVIKDDGEPEIVKPQGVLDMVTTLAVIYVLLGRGKEIADIIETIRKPDYVLYVREGKGIFDGQPVRIDRSIPVHD